MPQCACASSSTTQPSTGSFLMMGGKRKSVRSRRKHRKSSKKSRKIRKRSGRRRRSIKKRVGFQTGGMLGGPITSSVPFASSLMGAPYVPPDVDTQHANNMATKNYLT